MTEKMVNFRIDETLHREIKIRAAIEGCSMTQFFLWAIQKGLDELQDDEFSAADKGTGRWRILKELEKRDEKK